MNDLPLYKHHRLFYSIIDHELNGGGWHDNWDPAMKVLNYGNFENFKIITTSYFIKNGF